MNTRNTSMTSRVISLLCEKGDDGLGHSYSDITRWIRADLPGSRLRAVHVRRLAVDVRRGRWDGLVMPQRRRRSHQDAVEAALVPTGPRLFHEWQYRIGGKADRLSAADEAAVAPWLAAQLQLQAVHGRTDAFVELLDGVSAGMGSTTNVSRHARLIIIHTLAHVRLLCRSTAALPRYDFAALAKSTMLVSGIICDVEADGAIPAGAAQTITDRLSIYGRTTTPAGAIAASLFRDADRNGDPAPLGAAIAALGDAPIPKITAAWLADLFRGRGVRSFHPR